MKGIPEGVFGGDDRAVAPVLGVILLFGIAAIGLSVWQTTVIPSQNADTEFKHYMDVQGDMGDLRQAHLETVNSGEPQAPTLKLGTAYTTRIIGVNPPDPSGTIRDEDIGSFSLEGAPDSASDSMITTVDVCGVSQPSTDRLRYDPSYNRLSDRDAPPVMYENTVLYRETADGEFLVEGDQLLIQGSTINILPIQTDLDRTGRSTSIDLSSQGYLVEKDLEAGATPTIIVPTKIPASTWENELLESQMGDSVSKVLSEGEGLPDGGTIGENEVGIVLNEKGDPFPWTVRCAITTDGGTTDFTESVKPPQVLYGGVGRGGTTEHTPETNSDEMVISNGKWIEISSISEILLGGSDTTALSGDDLNGGEGIRLEFKMKDGESDETVFVQITLEKDNDGSWNEKTVKMGESPDDLQSPNDDDLTDEAAEKILEGGEPDILSPKSYQTSSFDSQDGDFGSYVDTIETMENATYQTTELQGRVDVQIISSELSLDIDDQSKIIKEGETSPVEFNVTATGKIEGSENVDLIVRDSDGQKIDDIDGRVDRQTLTDVDGEESFRLTWEPDWDQVDNGKYQILVEGESDQAFATVEVFQGGNVRLNVTIDNATSPVDYGDTVETNVNVENVGDIDADDAQLALSMAGQDGPQPEFDLAAGENTTLTLEYDTQEYLDPTNTGEKTLKATWNDESTDTETVVVEQPDIILDPQVEDLTAGEDGQNQTVEFTLGEDLTEGDEISVDVSDTGDDVDYDGNDGSWNINQGDGTVSPDLDNGKVVYKVGPDDSEDDTIKFEGSGVDASSAEPDIRYGVEYRVESADSYAEQANGDTSSTTFETTSGQQIQVGIVDSGSPIEYGDTFNATVRATNVGGAEGDSQILLSLAGEGGPQETVQLAPGASTNVTMTYDTEQLESDVIGEAELEAEARNDTDSRTVTVDPPTLIKDPTVEDVPAGDGRVNQTMNFTLGEDTGGASIKIDLTNTSDNVSYDADSANWTIVEGNGSISLNANNEVESVVYETNSESDLEGDRIVIAADYTDTSDADTASATEYDITYELTDASDYPTGETNSTSFETTPPG